MLTKAQRAWVLALWLALVGIAAIMISNVAKAHDHNRPDLDSWYRGLTRIDGEAAGTSCCKMNDCHTTEAEIRGGEWWARLGVPVWKSSGGMEVAHVVDWKPGPFVKVPDKVILKKVPNPTGSPVICHSVMVGPHFDPAGVQIFCFILAPLT